MPQTPGPAADLIEHAAGIIAAKMKEPNTAPYHWAGALWEAGMLHGPGSLPEQGDSHRHIAELAIAYVNEPAENAYRVSELFYELESAVRHVQTVDARTADLAHEVARHQQALRDRIRPQAT